MKRRGSSGFLGAAKRHRHSKSNREETPGEMRRESMPSPRSIIHSEIAHHRLA